MKKLTLSAAVAAILSLTSCSAVKGVFDAGMYWGIFLVIAVVAVIIWLFTRGRNQ